jgi:hypothetical protein
VRAHEHWHVAIAYLNLGGTFYYLGSLLDGASRAIVPWEIREAMTEAVVECLILRARELFADEHPRIISDNGPQLIAKDFKEFIRVMGMTHVRTSPLYPRSNGQLERYHKTIKGEAIRPGPAVDARGGARAGRPLRRALRHRPPAQRHRLHHARRPPRRPRRGGRGRARPQARSRSAGSRRAPRRPAGGGRRMTALRLEGGKGTFPHDGLPSRSDGGCHPQARSAAKEAQSALTPAVAEATPAAPSGEDPLRTKSNRSVTFTPGQYEAKLSISALVCSDAAMTLHCSTNLDEGAPESTIHTGELTRRQLGG